MSHSSEVMLSTGFLPQPSGPYMLLLFSSFAGKCTFIQAHSFLVFCYYWLFWAGEEWEWTMLTDKFKCKGQSKEAATAAKSLQSCPTLCDPIDGSPPGSPVPGILQVRTLEWVAISFSNA